MIAIPSSAELRPKLAQRIIGRCPCPRCTTTIALSRIAALRLSIPAINKGHAVRSVRMTPALRLIMQALLDQAPKAGDAAVPRVTDPTANLRTAFTKLTAHAGYEPDVEAWAVPLPQLARQRRHRLGRGAARPRDRPKQGLSVPVK